jgi:hypothetical protein
MRPLLRHTALLSLGTAAALVVVASRTGVASAASPDASARAAYAAETVRLRAHFDSVLVELRAPVARALTPAQRDARAERIATLQVYRDRGLFPHNHEHFDGWIPYFVDHRGVLCAVAFLLESSGRRDIVDRVAAADNNVWVPQLAGDAEFRAWLDASGLTLDEAARIQAPYIGSPPEQSIMATREDKLNTGLALVSGGLGAASMVWNARARGAEHRRLRAALGYTAGAMGLALAAGRRDSRGGALALGIMTGTIGIGSAAMATRTLMRDGRTIAPASPRASSTASLSVAPAMVATGDRMAPGVTMNLRF